MKTGAMILTIFLVVFVSRFAVAGDPPAWGSNAAPIKLYNLPTTGSFGLAGPNYGGFDLGDVTKPEAPIGKCQMADEADEKDNEGDEKQAQEDKDNDKDGQACIENLRTKKEEHEAAEKALRNFAFSYSEMGTVDSNQQDEFNRLTQAETTAREARKAAQAQCKAAAQARAEQCKQKTNEMKEACNKDIGSGIIAASDAYSKTSQGSAATINASASKLKSDLRDMRRSGVATCKQCKAKNRRSRTNCEKTNEFIANIKKTDSETDVAPAERVAKAQEKPIQEVEAVTLPQMAKSIEDINGLETQAGQLAQSAAMSTPLSTSSVFGNDLSGTGFPTTDGGGLQPQTQIDRGVTAPAAASPQAAAPQAQAPAAQAATPPPMNAAPQQAQMPQSQPQPPAATQAPQAQSASAIDDKLKPIVDNSTPNSTTQTKTEDQKAHSETAGNVAGSLYGGAAQTAAPSSVSDEAAPVPMALSSHTVGGIAPANFEKKDAAGGSQGIGGGMGTFVNGAAQPMSGNLAELKKQNAGVSGSDSGSGGGRRSSMSYIGGGASGSSSTGFKPSRYDDDDRQVAGATSKVDLRQFLPGQRLAGGRGPASQEQLGIHGAHVNFFNKVNERYHALQDSLDP